MFALIPFNELVLAFDILYRKIPGGDEKNGLVDILKDLTILHKACLQSRSSVNHERDEVVRLSKHLKKIASSQHEIYNKKYSCRLRIL